MLKLSLIMLSMIFLIENWLLAASALILSSCLWSMKLSFSLGLINNMVADNLSFFLILLSIWISFLMVISSYYIKFNKNKTKLFLLLVMLMNFLLILSFSCSNLLVFYILFEATLIPIFMLIFGWGYQPERVTASFYLLFYTLFASLPLLMAILYLMKSFYTLDFNLLPLIEKTPSMILFITMIIAFLVKLPVYFGHLWLPKAHVEAPMAGSMILAGILLKLGGYGLMRSVPLILELSSLHASWLINLGLFGALCASFICIRQTDLKSLIAYSSVAHMGLVIVGIFLLNWTSWYGCVIIMIAHGLCSSGLFCLVGILYYRMSSRSMLLIRGCISATPLLTLWWFLFAAANMAAPPTPNLAGEILIFMASVSNNFTVAILVGLASFLAGAYNLYLFSSTQHGNKSNEMNSLSEASLREHLTLFLHFAPLLLCLIPLLNLY